jgi:Xaa-Pro dipeptidase
MTDGVGGSTAEQELAALSSMREQAVPIGLDEYEDRLQKARGLMQQAGIDALYLDATTSLRSAVS